MDAIEEELLKYSNEIRVGDDLALIEMRLVSHELNDFSPLLLRPA